MTDRPPSPAEILVAVIDEGGFMAAARRLGLAQSTVSRQVSLLEARVGARLIARTTRRVALTDAGRFFVDRARDGLAALAEAEAGAAAVGAEPRGTLRVTAPAAFGREVLAPRLAAFAMRHPGVGLDLDLSDERRPLDRGRFDLAIRLGAAGADEPAGETLMESRLVLVAAPALARVRLDDPADLATCDAVVIADPHPRRDWPFRRGAERRRVRVTPRHVVTDIEAARALVRAGLGVTLLPDWFVRADLARGDLATRLPDWTAPAYPIRAIALAARLAKVAAALDWLRGGDDQA